MPEIGNHGLKRHHLIQITERQKHVQLTLPWMIHNLRHDHCVVGPETLHLTCVEGFNHIRNGMRIARSLKGVLHFRK